MLVVASLSDWDGHRIIGVFESEDAARKEIKNCGISLSSSSLSFDIVKKNQISLFQHIIYGDQDLESLSSATVRKHVYEEA